MTKGEIIESVLKDLRSDASVKRRRDREVDEEERDVIAHLEFLLRNAEPDSDIRTCADFVNLNVECCTNCHFFMFPFDMPLVRKLKNGEYAWICCAMSSAIKSTAGGEVAAKSPPTEQPAKSTGYKPFADFFGGRNRDHNDAK
jgi:hypothetical protein